MSSIETGLVKTGKPKDCIDTAKDAISNIDSFNFFSKEWTKALNFANSNIDSIIQDIENYGDKVHWNMVITRTVENTNILLRDTAELDSTNKNTNIIDAIIKKQLPKVKKKYTDVSRISAIKKFDGSKQSFESLKKILNEKQKANSPISERKIGIVLFLLSLFEELKIRKSKIQLSDNNTLKPDPLISESVSSIEDTTFQNTNTYKILSQKKEVVNWYHFQLLLTRILQKIDNEDEKIVFLKVLSQIESFRVKDAKSTVSGKMLSRGALSKETNLDTFGAMAVYPENEIVDKTKVLLQILDKYTNIIKISNKGLITFTEEQCENLSTILDRIKNKETNISDYIKKVYNESNKGDTNYLLFLNLIEQQIISPFEQKLLNVGKNEEQDTLYDEMITKVKDVYKKMKILEDQHNQTSNKILPFCNVTIMVDNVPLEIQIKCSESKSLKSFIEDDENKKLFKKEMYGKKEQNFIKRQWVKTMRGHFLTIAKDIERKISDIEQKITGKYEKYSIEQVKYFEEKKNKLLQMYIVYESILDETQFKNLEKELEQKNTLLEKVENSGEENIGVLNELKKQQQETQYMYDESFKRRDILENNIFEKIIINKGQEKDFFDKLLYTLSDLDHYIYKFNNAFIRNCPLILKKYNGDKQIQKQLQLYVMHNIGKIVQNINEKIFHIGNDEIQKNANTYVIQKLDMPYDQKIKWICSTVIQTFIKATTFFDQNGYKTSIEDLDKKLREIPAGDTTNKNILKKRIHEEKKIQNFSKELKKYLENQIK